MGLGGGVEEVCGRLRGEGDTPNHRKFHSDKQSRVWCGRCGRSSGVRGPRCKGELLSVHCNLPFLLRTMILFHVADLL